MLTSVVEHGEIRLVHFGDVSLIFSTPCTSINHWKVLLQSMQENKPYRLHLPGCQIIVDQTLAIYMTQGSHIQIHVPIVENIPAIQNIIASWNPH